MWARRWPTRLVVIYVIGFLMITQLLFNDSFSSPTAIQEFIFDPITLNEPEPVYEKPRPPRASPRKPTTESQTPVKPPSPVLPPITEPLPESRQTLDITTKIPRIIHQSWKSDKLIPSRLSESIRSWPLLNPNWTYFFWTDKDNERLISTKYPRFKETYRDLSAVSRADVARLAYMHEYGGFYVDLDFICLKPFENLTDHHLILSSEPIVHAVLLEKKKYAISNAFLASAKEERFWMDALELVKFRKGKRPGRRQDPVSISGPRVLDYLYRHDSYGIELYDDTWFFPEVAVWNEKELKRACREPEKWGKVKEESEDICRRLDSFIKDGNYRNHTMAVHKWQCSWCRYLGDRSFTSLSDILGKFKVDRFPSRK